MSTWKSSVSHSLRQAASRALIGILLTGVVDASAAELTLREVCAQAPLHATPPEAIKFLRSAVGGGIVPMASGRSVKLVTQMLTTLERSSGFGDSDYEQLDGTIDELYKAASSGSVDGPLLSTDEAEWLARTRRPDRLGATLDRFHSDMSIVTTVNRYASTYPGEDSGAFAKGQAGGRVLEILQAKQAPDDVLLSVARKLCTMHAVFRAGYQDGAMTPLVSPRLIQGVDARAMDDLLSGLPPGLRLRCLTQNIYRLFLCIDGLPYTPYSRSSYWFRPVWDREIQIVYGWVRDAFASLTTKRAEALTYELLASVDSADLNSSKGSGRVNNSEPESPPERGGARTKELLPWWVILDLLRIVPVTSFGSVVEALMPITRPFQASAAAQLLVAYRELGGAAEQAEILARALRGQPEPSVQLPNFQNIGVPGFVAFFVQTKLDAELDSVAKEGHYRLRVSSKRDGYDVEQYRAGAWRSDALVTFDEDTKTILSFSWNMSRKLRRFFVE